MRGEIAGDEIDPKADRIDVPRGDRKRRGRLWEGADSCLPGQGGERKHRWIIAHRRPVPSPPPVAKLVGGLVLVDVKQRRVWLGLQVDVFGDERSGSLARRSPSTASAQRSNIPRRG